MKSLNASQMQLNSCKVTEESDANTSGSTFGGHLLRLCYQHAVDVAVSHLQRPVDLVASEVAFLSLVPIGARLCLVR